tara:strand:+ start:3491 stop:4366 length:876 start_codon:yes stop_codon:yes gene_type:complete
MIFDNEDCYNYITINETNNPVIPSSDVTLILMMEGSERFKYDPFIMSLSKKTIIQYNKGYKNCVKDEEVTATTSDITHAYYTAFYYLREYNNVIILEEDAEMYSKDLADYALVNNFIENEEFSLFSFGSIGTYIEYKPGVFKDIYSVTEYASAQSNIFSKKGRQKLYKTIGENKFQGDIDTDYITKLDKLYSYKYPLIVQLMPLTENKSNWGQNHGIVVKIGCSFLNLFIMIFKLDKDTTGWKHIYIYNRHRWWLNYLFILLGIHFLYKIAIRVYPKLKMKMKTQKLKFKK